MGYNGECLIEKQCLCRVRSRPYASPRLLYPEETVTIAGGEGDTFYLCSMPCIYHCSIPCTLSATYDYNIVTCHYEHHTTYSARNLSLPLPRHAQVHVQIYSLDSNI